VNDVLHTGDRDLTAAEQTAVDEIKNIGERLVNRLDNEMRRVMAVRSGVGYRELLKARDRAEEADRWAVRGVTR